MRRKSLESLTHALRVGDGIGAMGVVVHPGALKDDTRSNARKRAIKPDQGGARAERALPDLLREHRGLAAAPRARLRRDRRADRQDRRPQAARPLHRHLPPLRHRLRHRDARGDEGPRRRDRLEGRPEQLKLIHVNDATDPLRLQPRPPRADPKGEIGRKGFRAFLGERRLQGFPPFLEGPGIDGQDVGSRTYSSSAGCSRGDPEGALMLLNRRAFDGIAAGEIDLAFRRWKRPTVKAGGHPAHPRRRPRHRRSRAGQRAPDQRRSTPGALVSPRGRADRAACVRRDASTGSSSIALATTRGSTLRQHAAITTSDRAELEARLARMDAREASRGPAVAGADRESRPETLAADLAASLGMKKLPFKRDVRKLKELGLTESLPVGYRLSPRGRAYLEAKAPSRGSQIGREAVRVRPIGPREPERHRVVLSDPSRHPCQRDPDIPLAPEGGLLLGILAGWAYGSQLLGSPRVGSRSIGGVLRAARVSPVVAESRSCGGARRAQERAAPCWRSWMFPPFAVDLPGRGDELHRALAHRRRCRSSPGRTWSRPGESPLSSSSRSPYRARPRGRSATRSESGGARADLQLLWLGSDVTAAAGRGGPWSGAVPRPRAEPAAAADYAGGQVRVRRRGSGSPPAGSGLLENLRGGGLEGGSPLRASRRSRCAALASVLRRADRQRPATSSRRPATAPPRRSEHDDGESPQDRPGRLGPPSALRRGSCAGRTPGSIPGVVRRIEEAPVDALVAGPLALVGPLDAELAMRQRIAGHLDPAEALTGALGEQEEVEVDLGAEDLVHAPHEAAAGARVLVGVEELASHLEAARGVDQLVAEGAALAAFAGAAPLGLCLPRHGVQSRHHRAGMDNPVPGVVHLRERGEIC